MKYADSAFFVYSTLMYFRVCCLFVKCGGRVGNDLPGKRKNGHESVGSRISTQPYHQSDMYTNGNTSSTFNHTTHVSHLAFEAPE